MKKGSKFIVVVTLVSVLLSFFTFPVFADTSSNISGISISRSQYTQAINRDATISSSGVNSANVTTYNNTIYFSYVMVNEWQISFTDQLFHSGYLDFTKYLSNSSNAVFDLISDSENVAVEGSRVYFSNKSAFTLKSYSYALSTVSAPGSVFPDLGIVLNSYTQASGYTIQDAITRIINTYTRVNSIYSLLNNSTSGFALIVPLLQDIADAEVTQEEWDDLISKVQAVSSNIATLGTTLSQAISSQTSALSSNLNSINQSIVSGLSAINNTLSQQIYSELSLMYTELLDIGQSLDLIYDYMQSRIEFDIPVESFYLNWSLLNSSPHIPIISNVYWSKYPIYQMSSGDSFSFTISPGSSNSKTIILGTDKNISNVAQFLSYFSFTSGLDISNFSHYGNALPQMRFFKFTLINNTSSVINASIEALSSLKLVGIYLSSSIGLTEDFASLWFGSDLQHTSDDFSSGVSDVIESSDEFSSYSDQLHDLDVGALDDMESSLTNIDTSISGSILSVTRLTQAANWVRTQYNRMTLNTPFASLITFSLTIGIVLILLGRLRS